MQYLYMVSAAEATQIATDKISADRMATSDVISYDKGIDGGMDILPVENNSGGLMSSLPFILGILALCMAAGGATGFLLSKLKIKKIAQEE